MCDSTPRDDVQRVLAPPPAIDDEAVVPIHEERAGSRRRRLWELPEYLHCPVIGVCLPLGFLRRLVKRVTGEARPESDYELHVGTVNDARRRTPLSQALQRELETRFAVTVKRYAQAKSQPALIETWEGALRGGDIAAHLWAAVTHARCDKAAHERIYRDVHMLQHQAGAMARADLSRAAAVQGEHAAQSGELERLRERCRQLQADRAAEAQTLGAQLMRLRAESIGKDTLIASLRAELTALQDSVPELAPRLALAQRVDQLGERNRALLRQLAEAREGRGTTPPPDTATSIEQRPQAAHHALAAIPVEARAVLCVGGRSGAIATYRELIESRGGRFIHHDGGIEDNPRLLDSSLAAADLVICQAGCVSHNAYWLVKEHCKRTGKRCVYLDKPSTSAFAKGLTDTAGDAGTPRDNGAGA